MFITLRYIRLMEFSLVCDYYSYAIGASFKVWFSCTCVGPDFTDKLKKINTPKDGLSVFQQRVIFSLQNGDCRISHRGSGIIIFDEHEFLTTPEGTGIRITLNDECSFLVEEKDVISYIE